MDRLGRELGSVSVMLMSGSAPDAEGGESSKPTWPASTPAAAPFGASNLQLRVASRPPGPAATIIDATLRHSSCRLARSPTVMHGAATPSAQDRKLRCCPSGGAGSVISTCTPAGIASGAAIGYSPSARRSTTPSAVPSCLSAPATVAHGRAAARPQPTPSRPAEAFTATLTGRGAAAGCALVTTSNRTATAAAPATMAMATVQRIAHVSRSSAPIEYGRYRPVHRRHNLYVGRAFV